MVYGISWYYDGPYIGFESSVVSLIGDFFWIFNKKTLDAKWPCKLLEKLYVLYRVTGRKITRISLIDIDFLESVFGILEYV